ncbi:hypothetical protein L9F63_001021 [Diploptera punctata]|uniref:CDP-diacylglycerol--glycerol-3-phosphate 3-phosphatidyltransferase n=1 Tax=Diploptera punctata TaxID=6984 RepID=A0AAD8ESU4_DIPPU|nr:hypothetical protein L9F63_001021 [Diploptera punctata]
MKKNMWMWARRFIESDSERLSVTNKMDLLRKLSSILQRQDTGIDYSNQEFVIANANSKVPEGISKDFETHGLTWLHTVSPCFALDGSKVSVIHEPSTFYSTVIEKCHLAKRRITLASLYIGTGHLEEQLISAIGENLKTSNGQLKVKVLLDYTRGSRGENNSRTMLLPLVNKYKDLCQVALYHTPALRGPLRTIMPQRYNEVIGLQHMKVYLFDDSLLISGANLSIDYFTNRQDRYILIEDCGPLADFYDGLVSQVSEFSLQLLKDNETKLHTDWQWHPYKGEKYGFESAARDKICRYYSSAMSQQKKIVQTKQVHHNDLLSSAFVVQCTTDLHKQRRHMDFPSGRNGAVGFTSGQSCYKRLFESALPGSVIHLATGYFNLTQEYINTMIHHSSATYNILMAHPTANGFMGARGPAGGIPAAYTLLASAFLRKLQGACQAHRVHMAEFQKKGWTYHAKGLWYTLPDQHLPMLTFVGSPNFGNRSVSRDLETQIVIVTKNTRLQNKLLEERERLYASGTQFSSETLSEPDRRNVPLWVHLAVRLFRGLL